MRCLERNKQTLYYSRFIEKRPLLDSNGLMTGEFKSVYSDPEELKVNISRANGNVKDESFGLNVNYTHTFITDNLDLEIDENCVLWYGIPVTEPYNFVVATKPAKSLNFMKVAIKSVNKSEDQS